MEGQGPLKWDEKAKAANKASNTLKTAANSSKSIKLFMATIDKSDSNNTNDKHIELYVASSLKSLECQQTWIVDSGVSAHMSSQHDWFTSYQEIHPPCRIWLGDHCYIKAVGKGQIPVNMKTGTGTLIPAIFQSILHVPNLNGNLLSM
jgi:Pol polyprotein, beta-barrel domain